MRPVLGARTGLLLTFRSGPKRYDYNEEKDTWFYARDGELMGELLNRELGEAFAEDVDVGLGTVSDKVV